MVERPQLKASDGSMTAHSASPRATPPFPFPREKLKKGYASFRAAGPPWNSSLIPWMSFRAARPPLPFPSRRLRMTEMPSASTQKSEVMAPYVEDPASKIGNQGIGGRIEEGFAFYSPAKRVPLKPHRFSFDSIM